MTTLQTDNTDRFTINTTDEIVLTEHDQDRSSGLPFFAGVLGYLIALPALALACTWLGII